MLGLNEKRRQLKEFDKENGEKNLFYFGKIILDYDKFEKKPHKEICDFAQDPKHQKRVDLEPRGVFKTTIFSQTKPIWKIIKNPNIRILLASVKLSNCESNLRVIKNHFRNNEKIREIWGDFVGKETGWATDKLTVTKRTNYKLKEPTISIAAVGSVEIGPHYDYIVLDDAHDRENSKTEYQIAEVKEFIRLLFGLLEPGGEMDIVGTRWHYTDAMSMLLGETEDADEQKIARLITGKRIRGCYNDNGTLYAPTVLTEQHITDMRGALGARLFHAQMENKPQLLDGSAYFEQRYFKRYESPKTPDEIKNFLVNKNFAITIDPGGEKKNSDFWTIFAAGLDHNAHYWFDDYLKFRGGLSLAAEKLHLFLKKYSIKTKVGFETTAQQYLFLTSIKEYLVGKYNMRPKFIELKHAQQSKDSRIETLQPKYEAGLIHHSKKMSEPYGLEDQLLKYPRGKDDIADAASMELEILKIPKKQPQPKIYKTQDEYLIAQSRENRWRRKVMAHSVLGAHH